ncbi:MAG: PhaM family polyhydroxyalkanoate granule multifunctional regulatory protein [Castellaniella sp.]
MATPNPNPFVLPGLGQSGEMAANPLLASMEMMRKAWEGMATQSGAGVSPLTGTAMLPQDLERRIADLRTVENWLRMNLSMLGGTIQALEVQRATIATLKAFVDSAGSMARPMADAAESVLPAMVSGDSSGMFGAPLTGQSPEPASGDAPAAEADAAPEAAPANPAEAAMHAWWDMLQTQFDQLASATAATFPGAGTAPGTDAEAPRPARKTAARKAAARKTAAAGATAGKTAAKKVARKAAGKRAARKSAS